MTLTPLTAVEIAVGNVLGQEEPVTQPELGAGLESLAALENVVRPAPERPPCVVSFSGGRDSSALLGAATLLARREGLELPLPVTLRFPGADSADESVWQELVIRELGLIEWEKIDLEDADLLGSRSVELLRRHGVPWPANSFLVDTVAQAASSKNSAAGGGGSLLTGLGGDELFGTWRWRRLADVLARRRRPEPRDIARAGYGALPSRARLPRERRRVKSWLGEHLRGEALEVGLRLTAERAAGEPVWWSNRLRWRARNRSLLLQAQTLQTLAADAGMQAAAPFLDQRFIDALAQAGGRFGFGDRTETMLAAFGDVAPEALLRRRAKATGEDIFWVGNSRSFAQDWDGSGVDHELVDPEVLRREWLSEHPNGATASLLQSAWLHADRAAEDLVSQQ